MYISFVVLWDSNEIINSIVSEMVRSYEICFVSEIFDINPFGNRAHFMKGSPVGRDVMIKSNVAEAKHVIIASEADSTTILATALVRGLHRLSMNRLSWV